MKPIHAGLSLVVFGVPLSGLSVADVVFGLDLRPWGETAALMLVGFLAASLFVAMPPGG